jgi:tetratricopeptide (TPR) repeat protein
VLSLAIERLASQRVLLIVTFRPEFTPSWGRPSHVTSLAIERLGRSDVGAMIDRVVGAKVLPANVRHDILERADGIPLFVEEMTKAVLALATTATAAMRSTGATAYAPWYLSYMAKAYAQLGQLDDARRSIAESMTAAEVTGEKWCEADIHRIAGEIALMASDRDAAKAEAYFIRALSIARTQQARSFELRAATRLAWLWHDRGKDGEARDLLAPVLGSFAEGLATADLIEAKSLLATFAS